MNDFNQWRRANGLKIVFRNNLSYDDMSGEITGKHFASLQRCGNDLEVIEGIFTRSISGQGRGPKEAVKDLVKNLNKYDGCKMKLTGDMGVYHIPKPQFDV